MRHVYLVCAWGLVCLSLSAQDPSFSQFYANRVYLNPALTALESGISVSGIYRMQWVNVDQGFKTYAASVELQEPALRSGIGLHVFQDVEGIMQLKTSYVGLSYAYTIPFDRQQIHIGLQSRWVQKSVDWDKILFSDQLDPVYGAVLPTSANPGMDRVTYTDFDMGVVWRIEHDLKMGKRNFRNTRHSIGLSLAHAPGLFSSTGVDESLQNLQTRTPPRLTLHAGSIIPMWVFGSRKRSLSVSPNFKFDMQGVNLGNVRENLKVFTVGAYLIYQGVYVGGFLQNRTPLPGYKDTNALILMMGAYVDSGRKEGNKFFLGFSYDANTTGLGTPAGGVYELAFRYTISAAPTLFGGAAERRSRKPLDCYNFF